MLVARYNPSEGAPQEIGWIPPVLDLHGSPMVPGRLASASSKQCVRTFRAGRPFTVDDKADPHLARHIKTDKKNFTVTASDPTVSWTRAGSGLGGPDVPVAAQPEQLPEAKPPEAKHGTP